MKSSQSFLVRHAVPTFFVLTFTLSWGGILWLISGPANLLVPLEETENLLPLAILVMLVGPTVAGLAMTVLVHGRTGLRQLLGRLLRWRVGLRWYAASVLIAPLALLISMGFLATRFPDFVATITAMQDIGSLIVFSIAAGLGAGIFEELGWTGFAVPELKQRHSVLTTGLIVGLAWGGWHVLVYVWGSGDATGGFAWARFVPNIAVFAGILPAYRVLMVWVFDRTESLLLAMLMHASLTAGTQLLMPPAAGMPSFIYGLIVAAILWAIVLAVALANRGYLTRHHAVQEMTAVRG